MDIEAFRASLDAAEPPPDVSDALRALWLDARGNWDGAHDSAQADEGGAGDWVHAYLHRKEDDAGNRLLVSLSLENAVVLERARRCGPHCGPWRGRGLAPVRPCHPR
jgi:hypothetical protein